MITSPTPHVANFGGDLPDGRPRIPSTMPVVAWDDDGRALVVDYKKGRLTPAENYKNFLGVDQASPRYVAAIPGGGWQLAWKKDDGTEYIEPVLGWAIDSNGWGQALSADFEGVVEIVEPNDGNPRFIPPAVPGEPTERLYEKEN